MLPENGYNLPVHTLTFSTCDSVPADMLVGAVDPGLSGLGPSASRETLAEVLSTLEDEWISAN